MESLEQRAMLAIDMSFVTVGGAGNEDNPSTGAGGVDYTYQIAQTEVTVAQYAEFLNSVAKSSDPFALYNPSMAPSQGVDGTGISRANVNGGYTYNAVGDDADTTPIGWVSWWDAARFTNWYSNGQGEGAINDGAYRLKSGTLSGASNNNGQITYWGDSSGLRVGDVVVVSGMNDPMGSSGMMSNFNIEGPVIAIPSPNEFVLQGGMPGYWGMPGYDETTGIPGIPDSTSGAFFLGAPEKAETAEFWIPTYDEWYKAAAFDPAANGHSGGYVNAHEATSPSGTAGQYTGREFVGTLTDLDQVLHWRGVASSATISGISPIEGLDEYADLGFRLASSPANRGPVAISLSSSTVQESNSVGLLVGALATVDPNAGDSFTYSLVEGEGSAGNAAFEIVGAELRAKQIFDFEARASYSIRIRSTDADGLWIESPLIISVTNRNERPLEISLSNATVVEGTAYGIPVGRFTTTDPDVGDTFTYSFVTGSGDIDNAAFQLQGDTLTVATDLDVDTKSLYSIRVRSTDAGGLSTEQTFEISVGAMQVGDAYIYYIAATGEVRMNPGTAVGTSGRYSDPSQVPLSHGVNSFGVEMDPAIGRLSTNVTDYYFPSGTWPLFFPQTGANPGNAFGSAFQAWSLPNVTVTGSAAGPSSDSLNSTNLVVGSPWVAQTGGKTGSTGAALPGTTAVYASTIPGYEGTPEWSFGTIAPTGLFEEQALAAFGATTNGGLASGNRIYSLQNVVGTQYFKIYVTAAPTPPSDAPTDIILSSNSIEENQPIGTIVGVFSTIEPDAGDTHTYSLVAGSGDTDNAAFEIVGNKLRANQSFDYETKASYSVRVRSTDFAGLWVETPLTISVSNVNERPVGLGLSNAAVAEGSAFGTSIGRFTTTDPDVGDSFTYSFVAGSGGADNGAFRIQGDTLTVAANLEFDTKSLYSVRVRSTDAGGLATEQTFQIVVQNQQVGDAYIYYIAATGEVRMNPGNAVGTGGRYSNPSQSPLSWGVNSFGVEMDPAIGTLSTDVTDYYFPSGTWPLFFPQTGANPGNAFGSAFQTWSLPNVTVAGGAAGPSNDSLNSTNLVIGSPWTAQTEGKTGSTGAPLPGTTAVYASTIPGYEGTPEWSFGFVAPTGLSEQDALAAFGATAQGGLASGNRIYSLQNVVGTQSFKIYVSAEPTPTYSAPTDITLSSNLIEENQPIGTVVGLLLTVDPDAGDIHTYSLVAGSGDTDNATFEIVGNALRAKQSFDYETKATFSIRVRSTDSAGLWVETPLTISVANVNERPVDLALSSTTVTEGLAAGLLVGRLTTTDPDAGDTFTYALVAGSGDTDNAAFEIIGDELRAKQAFNYEAKDSYTIRIRSTDAAGESVEKTLTIAVLNANEAPTALSLSHSIVLEGTGPGLPIGSFTTTDQDAADSFTYGFAAGPSSDDNDAFTITDGVLYTKEPLSFAAKSTYSIRVRTTDAGGLWVEQPFLIVVQRPQVGDAFLIFYVDTGELRLNPGNAGSGRPDAQGLGVSSFGIQPDPTLTFTTDAAAYSYPSGTYALFPPDRGGFNIVGAAFFELSAPNATENVGYLSHQNLVVSPAVAGTSGTITWGPGNGGVFESTLPGTGYEGTPEWSFGNIGPTNLTEAEALAAFGITEQGGVAVGQFQYSIQNVLGVQYFRVFTAQSPPPAIQLTLSDSQVAENLPAGSAVGRVSATSDDPTATFTYALVSGVDSDDNALFSLDGDLLRTAASFDFEAEQTYSIRVRATDSLGATSERVFKIHVTDVNEAPTGLVLTDATLSFAENTNTATPIRVTTIGITDDALGANSLVLSGADASSFEIDGDALYLKAGTSLDFEAKSSYAVTVTVSDSAFPSAPPVTADFSLTVTDVNEAPTAVDFVDAVTTLPENTPTPAPLKVADIRVTDDALGGLLFSLTGDHADAFALEGRSLYLKAGTVLDFEIQPAYLVSVVVADSQLFDAEPVIADFTLRITDVNEPASAIVLRDVVEALPENTNTNERVLLARIDVQDDALGVNQLTLSGADAAAFELDGLALYLRAGVALDFETQPLLAVSIRAADANLAADTAITRDYTLGITDVNESPTAVGFANSVTELAERSQTDPRIKLADITITDDALGSNRLTLDGPDASSFALEGTSLYLAAGVVLDFEAKSAYSVTVSVADRDLAVPVSADFLLVITDVNEHPTDLELADAVDSLPENTSTAAAIKVADILITDDALGTNSVSLVGPDATRFEIVDAALYLKAGTALDFEAQGTYSVAVVVIDPAAVDSLPLSVDYVLDLVDLNEAPTSLALADITASIAENTEVPERLKVADLLVVDDALGDNRLTLSGPDAATFVIDGTGLYLVADTLLDFEAKADYTVTVTLSDSTLPDWTPLTTDFSLAVTDVNEAPTAVYFRNVLAGIAENTPTPERIKVADIEVEDDALGALLFSLAGDDADAFLLDGGALYLKAGASLDFETHSAYSVSVAVADIQLFDDEPVFGDLTLPITDINEAPTALSLGSDVTAIQENTGTAEQTRLADILVTDDALGTNVFALTGPDAASFEIAGNALLLKAGITLDFETQATYSATVSLVDPSLPDMVPLTTEYTLTLIDVNEAPTNIGLINTLTDISENTPTTDRIPVASVVVTDDALGANLLTVAGAAADVFEIVDGSLYLKAGTRLDFEATPFLDVTVSAADPSLPDSEPVQIGYRLTLLDVNEAPTAVNLAIRTATIPENTVLTERVPLADITVSDDALGTNTLSLQGADAGLFEIVTNTLFFKPGQSLDYESTASYDVTVVAADLTLPEATAAEASFRLAIEDVNEFPTSFELVDSIASLPENTATLTRLAIAGVRVVDDALGTNQVSLTGPDAAAFEIVDGTLFLRAGVRLDFETKPSFEVGLALSDLDLPGFAPLTVTHLLTLTDVNEAPTALAIANPTNSLPENTSTATRLKVADLVVTDDALGTNTFALSGAGSDEFEVVDGGLFVKAGRSLDYEARSTYTLTVSVQDATIPGSVPQTATYRLTLTDVNEAPTAIRIANPVAGLPEGSATTTRTRLGTLALTDDALGTNVITLSGPDAASFEVLGITLYLRSGRLLDFETKATYSVNVAVSDATVAGSNPVTTTYVLSVIDINEAPTAVTLSNSSTAIPEDTPTVSRTRVADIVITDDALGSNTLGLAGLQAALFEIADSSLYLRAGVALDYESLADYSVIVTASDATVGESQPVTTTYRLALTDVNEAPTAVVLRDSVASLPENMSTAARIKVADLAISDDALGTNTVSLTGSDAAAFEVVGSELFLKAGTPLDYETQPTYAVTVRVADETLFLSPAVSANYVLAITDVNDAPTAVTLTNRVTSLAENANTASRTKLADIVITDDALGSETVSLAGVDAARFEVIGTALYLRAGTLLDYETASSLDVTVNVRDLALPDSSAVTAGFTLTITNVNEAPTALSVSATTVDELRPVGTLVGTLTAEDPDGDTSFTFSLVDGTGAADNAAFAVSGNRLVTASTFDIDDQASYSIRLRATDAGGLSFERAVTITISDVNEAPTGLTLSNRIKAISSNRDLSQRFKVADVSISDDTLGTNTLLLSGPDASLFEVDATGLYLKPGVVLDGDSNPSFDVWVRVYDATALGVPTTSGVMAFYSPATGNLRLENMSAFAAPIQGVTIDSPAKALAGSTAAIPPDAVFVTSNSGTSGPAGTGSRISFASIGQPSLTLTPGEAWDFGNVAIPGLSKSEIAAGFLTEREAGPAPKGGTFLFSLIVNGFGTPNTLGAIALSHGENFSLDVVSVPTYDTQETITTAAGQTQTDSQVRSGAAQLVKQGDGTLILDGTSSHSGGTVIEAGEVIIRNVAALGTGGIEVRPGAKLTLDVGTGKVDLAALLIDDGGSLDVGRGGLRIAAGGVSAARVRELLLAGRNGGSWDGPGIASDGAGPGTNRAVGYRVLPSGEVHVGWAAPGDANLDGLVDVRDLNLLVSNGRFGQTTSAAGWWQGDLNYNGVFDASDVNILINTALFGQGSYYPQPVATQSFSLMAAASTGAAPSPTSAAFASLAETDPIGPTTTATVKPRQLTSTDTFIALAYKTHEPVSQKLPRHRSPGVPHEPSWKSGVNM